ncbi:MAG: class I SAM-dependent methyltransferase [Armatimonadota bacterium]
MKVRESGMPEESYWDTFFDPPGILSTLRLDAGCRDVVEVGCGYGTFTIPAARIVSGVVQAFDIEPEMVRRTAEQARELHLANVRAAVRDLAAEGTGLPGESVDYVMLFNILHAENPLVFLREAWRVLRRGGRAGIIHWNYDADTPRGPSMAIRPRPEQCREWAEVAGLHLLPPGVIDLPPYHYGLVCVK